MTTKTKRKAVELTDEEKSRRAAAAIKGLEATGRVTADEGVPGPIFRQLQLVRSALRAERERQGRTMEDVAKSAGMDQPALSRLERGETLQPTLATLWRVAEALGMDLAVCVAPRATSARK
ncbi:MAG TPA: helix-turn-helix transcriptional regulator [Planctomycetia bacterium]|nr:helix-turn-helix transcriptional regulator [Planctomycetia bacterium]